MARRQYSSCRTVNWMGTFAPAWSQPSGQEFLRRDLGVVVFGRLAMVFMHLNVRVGALRLWPVRAAGGRRRNPNTGAPPDGR